MSGVARGGDARHGEARRGEALRGEPDARLLQELIIRTHLVRGDGRAESGLAWFRTGAAHEELNGVLRVTADRVDDGFRALDGVPALWHSWPGDPDHDVEEALLARGFRFVEEEPVMVRPLDSLPAAESTGAEGVTLRWAADAADLVAWASVWTGASADPSLVQALEAAGLNGPVRYLLADEQAGDRGGGEVVGCAAAVIASDALAVEHVVTAAGHRGRGIGTALTAAVLADGRARGAATAVLTASPDGAGLYRRLGFAERTRVRRFAAS